MNRQSWNQLPGSGKHRKDTSTISQIDTTNTFVDGDIVNAATMNNIIDQASALEGIISAQPLVTPANTDQLLVLRPGAPNTLKKATISALPGAGTVTNVSAVLDNSAAVFGFTVATGTTTPAIHLSLDPQYPNTILAGAPTGAGTSTPTFRGLAAADLAIPISVILASSIDWNLNNLFYQSVPTGPRTFSFANVNSGQVIKVILMQGGGGTPATVAWSYSPAIRWRGGAAPVLSTTNGHSDVYTFICEGTTILGHSDKDYF